LPGPGGPPAHLGTNPARAFAAPRGGARLHPRRAAARAQRRLDPPDRPPRLDGGGRDRGRRRPPRASPGSGADRARPARQARQDRDGRRPLPRARRDAGRLMPIQAVTEAIRDLMTATLHEAMNAPPGTFSVYIGPPDADQDQDELI